MRIMKGPETGTQLMSGILKFEDWPSLILDHTFHSDLVPIPML